MVYALVDLQRPKGNAERGGARRAPVLVVGLGKTGVACVRHLRGVGDAPVEVADSRAVPPGIDALRREFPDVRAHLGGFDASLFEHAASVVLSPGVSIHEPAVERALERGVPVLGEIELFARAVDAPVAAITGSNGKSTVTSLLGEMAAAAGRRAAVGGNLGTPALELLARARALGTPDIYLLELSSFQLETTSSLDARVAAVLNLSPDHLDRHGSLGAYAAAKSRIFRGSGAMVLNLDDPAVAAMAVAGRETVGFSIDEAVLTRPRPPGYSAVYGLARRGQGLWLVRSDAVAVEPLVALGALPLAGRHNAANALAALAIGSVLELGTGAMLDGLRAFSGLAHRCELVADRDGVRWYDDSKATNVGAAAAAIEGIGERSKLVLIAGGDGKGAAFDDLAGPLARHGRCAVLIGHDADRIERAVGAAVPVARAGDLEQAVAMARKASRPGDSVLFSPACASFDMFEDYVARGEAFARAVRALLGLDRDGNGSAGKNGA